MSTYAIGDIQGCYKSFKALLKKIDFDPNGDQLWLTGDLVNRGGRSLEVLEYLYSIRKNIITVLGNHDLHLLAAYYGYKKLSAQSDLLPIFKSPNANTLITWLESKPLLHRENGHVLVHAGIHPMWNLKHAQQAALEVETALAKPKTKLELLAKMYKNEPSIWDQSLTGIPRLRCIINIFTRMRFLNKKNNALNFNAKGSPLHPPKNLVPWFEAAGKKPIREKIIIGHWASMLGETLNENIIALDTGCVWGGSLTAYNLETQQRIQQNYIE